MMNDTDLTDLRLRTYVGVSLNDRNAGQVPMFGGFAHSAATSAGQRRRPSASPTRRSTPIAYGSALLAQQYVQPAVPQETVHYGVVCEFCGKSNIKGVRYKCLQCGGASFFPLACPRTGVSRPRLSRADCNRCSSCMSSPKAWSSHDPTHHFFPIENSGALHDYDAVKKTQVVHQNVVCDGCGGEDIVGVRFKCLVCESACPSRSPSYPT